MTKPVTIPTAFAGSPPPWQLSQLDGDFAAVAASINDLGTYSNYAVDTGTANNYIVTFGPGITINYVAGLKIEFKALNGNPGGASTLNVNGLGAKAIVVPTSAALSPGQINPGQIVTVMYDGTNFQLMYAGSYAVSSAMQPVVQAASISTAQSLLGVPLTETATGTNAIALTPTSGGAALPAAYANFQKYCFYAPSLTSGLVTVQFQALAALPLYSPDGTTQLNASDLYAGRYYECVYNSNVSGFTLCSGVIGVVQSRLSHGQVRFENDGGAQSGVLYGWNGGGLYVKHPTSGQYVLVQLPTIGVGDNLATGGLRFNKTACNLNLTQGQSLANNTLYYAYLTLNVAGLVGTPSINFSTNAHTSDPVTGFEVMNNAGVADPTQTLVGMLYTLGGSIAGTNTNQLCQSWFQRIATNLYTGLTGSFSNTGAPFAEVSSTQRLNFTMWGDDDPFLVGMAQVFNSSSGKNVQIGTAIDASIVPGSGSAYAISTGASEIRTVPIISTLGGTSEGFHYITVVAKVDAGTGSIQQGFINLYQKS
jgi:hypothetical protein